MDVLLTWMLRAAIAAIASASLTIAWVALPASRQIDQERVLHIGLIGLQSQDFEATRTYFDRMQARLAAPGCPAEGLSPALAMAVWLADHPLSLVEADVIDTRLDKALELAQRSVRCEPLEALGWLTLGRLTLLREGAADASLAKLRFSARVAPREAWARWQRAAMLLDQRRWLAVDDRRMLVDDLVALVEAEAQWEVAMLLRRADRAFQSEVSMRIGRLPFDAQRRYQAAAIDVMVDVSGLTIPVSSRSGDEIRRRIEGPGAFSPFGPQR